MHVYVYVYVQEKDGEGFIVWERELCDGSGHEGEG